MFFSSLDNVANSLNMKSCPENDTTDLNSSNERRGDLGITHRDVALALQLEKSIFYKMVQFIKGSIIVARIFAALSGWNDHLHPCCHCFLIISLLS